MRDELFDGGAAACAAAPLFYAGQPSVFTGQKPGPAAEKNLDFERAPGGMIPAGRGRPPCGKAGPASYDKYGKELYG